MVRALTRVGHQLKRTLVLLGVRRAYLNCTIGRFILKTTFRWLKKICLNYNNMSNKPFNIISIVTGKFRREFHRSYFKCLCCCHTTTPEQSGTSFAPIGSSRGTTRTVVRRNDSCASYRLTHLSPSNHNINRDYVRNTNTSFIENLNGNRRPKMRDDSISEGATRFTLTNDACRD